MFYEKGNKKVTDEVHTLEQEKWLSNLWHDSNLENGNKMRLYRNFKTRIRTESCVTASIPCEHRKILSKLGSSSLQIGNETGRFENVPLENRICKFCPLNEVEDEQHVLINCTLYDDLRHKLFNEIIMYVETFNDFKTLEKYCVLKTNNLIKPFCFRKNSF